MTANVELAGREWRARVTVSVPAEPIRLMELLPMAQSIADRVVESAAKEVEDQGKRVSCRAGCGACCRQLVPIAEVEAGHIRKVIGALPEPRRAQVRARFAEARRRLEAAGLLGHLLHPEDWSDRVGQPIGLEYFRQGIPCPFLENESCSIYADRPIACREYLVTSPPEMCARPTAETVEGVKLPMKVWTALVRFDEVPAGGRFLRWVPLILAPEWAETHPEEPPARPGPDLLREFFDNLTGGRQPVAQPAQSPFDQESLPASVEEGSQR